MTGRLAGAMLTIAVASAVSGAQRSGDSRTTSLLPKSSGLLTLGRDGNLRMASAARITHEAGWFDKLGSFLVGLGYQAPGFDSAALCLVRLTPRGLLDPGFGNNGSVITPLLPLENHDRVTVTALLEDATGRAIVIGWRPLSAGVDASVPVIVAARYTSAGALDPSFGERGIVTTRIERDYATQAYAATVDGDGRLLVAVQEADGHLLVVASGKNSVQLARYDKDGRPDQSFGSSGVISTAVDKTVATAAGLAIDDKGIPVVTVVSPNGIFVLRFNRGGPVDKSFQAVANAHP